ncbi:MAG: response regulator, partial [Kiloniellaceae bacterium]
VRADQVQLEQVIIILAVNARDAMDHGGTLTIRTRNETTAREKKYKAESMPPGDYVLIEVRDTGRGIAQEHRDRIFDPFFSTKEVGAGTGLGLSTVYGIVKQTEGFVFVDTEPGAGTLFSIYLPRAAAKAEPGAVAEETGARAGRDLTGMGTVLLVEDEDAVRAFGARALRNKGYEVVEARSGDAALQVMEKQGDEIDLLVTDVVMPQLDGPTLVRQVRETWPNLKVIFISGYTEDAFRQKLGEDEHIHFLPKPFSLKQLAAKVKEVMSEEARAPTTAQRSSGA